MGPSYNCFAAPKWRHWKDISVSALLLAGIFSAAATATAAAVTQNLPVAALPQVFIDTTYHHPGGATHFVNSGEKLQETFNAAQPGDTIVLDSHVTYTGNFTLHAKNNPNQKWIYIVTSALSELPLPGSRVSPKDAPNMPKLVTPNAQPALLVENGGGFVRLVGVEMFSTSTQHADPNHQPWPVNGFTYFLLLLQGASHVTVDRCYFHGSNTEDINHGIGATKGSSYTAVVDSDVRDIHGWTNDSQAFIAFASSGPFKLVNNFLSASTEDVMFGGAGGYSNPLVPSDIEIRNNHFWKDPAWEPMSSGQRPFKWTIKNHIECKACLRMVASGNLIENAWYGSDQVGAGFLLTPRTNQSGYNSVDDDITIENNVIRNVNLGFQLSGADFNCRPPTCEARGETKRLVIRNNLILTRDPSSVAASHPTGFNMGRLMDGVLIQHNTVTGINGSQVWFSVFFNGRSPEDRPVNVWMLDNVFSGKFTGDGGSQGEAALDVFMPQPSPAKARFTGNLLSDSVRYKDPASGNFELASSKTPATADGVPPGVEMSKIQAAMVSAAAKPPEIRPQVVLLKTRDTAEFHSAKENTGWQLTPRVGSVSATGLYTAPANVRQPSGVTLCAGSSGPDQPCASIVLLPAP